MLHSIQNAYYARPDSVYLRQRPLKYVCLLHYLALVLQQLKARACT